MTTPAPLIRQTKRMATRVDATGDMPHRQVLASSTDIETVLSSEKTAARRLFSAISDYPGAGARKIGALTGISPNVSTFRLAVTKLRKADLIVGDSDEFQLTMNGRRAAVQFPSVIATGRSGVDHWRSKLSGASLRLFESLITHKGTPLLGEQLGNHAGVPVAVSTFRLAMTKLRKLDLISESDGLFSINEELV